MPSDESELVARCLAGCESAYREFVERYETLVFGVCLRSLGDRHDAEDVAQEVFLRALRHLRSWDSSRPLRPWLLTIAANRCRTELSRRKRRRAESAFLDELPDRRPEPDDASELLAGIHAALGQLRGCYRQVFLLFHEQGLSYDEMATVVGKPIGTLKTWLHRARKEVLTILRGRGLVAEAEGELSRVSGRTG